MQGRATRLFVGPLLASLEQLVGKGPFLQYLQSFRYPLAGEFAFTKDLAMNLRIPCDWGLEIGLLSEVYRNVRTSKIAQVDLGLFDHKHKNIGDSSKEGLQKNVYRNTFKCFKRSHGASSRDLNKHSTSNLGSSLQKSWGR